MKPTAMQELLTDKILNYIRASSHIRVFLELELENLPINLAFENMLKIVPYMDSIALHDTLLRFALESIDYARISQELERF
jgi:hypothetical protein